MKQITYTVLAGLIALLVTAFQAQAAEVVTYYHNDHLGSPIAATDSSGTVVWEQVYDPWGETLITVSDDRAFTGSWRDPATGLSDFKARWHSTSIGRLMSPDPVGFYSSNVQSFNRYAYGNNSPYRYTDPSGQIPVDTVWDAGNVVWDLGKIGVGKIVGNQQWVDEGQFDLAADSLAMAIPYLPAGASRLRHLLDGADDAVDAAKGGSRALRPVGQILESVDDVMVNPQLLKGVEPSQLMSRVNLPDNWVVGTMNRTRNENKGFTLRELNSRGTDYTDRYIQYHPGSGRHFNGQPYWKVSSGNGGTVRFPVHGD